MAANGPRYYGASNSPNASLNAGDAGRTAAAALLAFILVFILIVMATMIAQAMWEGPSDYSKTSREGYTAPHTPNPELEAAKWADRKSLMYPTKCVSCERVYPAGERWRAQPTKCFACEAAAQAHGLMDPQDTHPNKVMLWPSSWH